MSDMLVHHMSNRYVGAYGIDEHDFDKQLAFMLSKAYDRQTQQELFITTKNIDDIRWDKAYYYHPDHDLLSFISEETKTILSVGCGYPSTETMLVRKNLKVTAIPLDPLVGSIAEAKGVKVMESDFKKAFRDLNGALFDCIILSEVLQHLEDPADILSRSVELLEPNGELLISIPNFRYLKYLKDHFPYPFFKRWTYSRNYLQMVDKNDITTWFRSIGFKNIDFRYVVESQTLKKLRSSFGVFNVILASRLLARGKHGKQTLVSKH